MTVPICMRPPAGRKVHVLRDQPLSVALCGQHTHGNKAGAWQPVDPLTFGAELTWCAKCLGLLAAERGELIPLAQRLFSVSALVTPYRNLLIPEYDPKAEDQTRWILDTARCYICGTDNFTGDHLGADGFARACPTGILRAEADTIRRNRGETVPC